jgi:hypothetical protein
MTIVMRGLYYSYIITSQSYLIVRSIINSINALDKLYTTVELNIVVKPVAELAGAITVIKYYTGSTTLFYITNYY